MAPGLHKIETYRTDYTNPLNATADTSWKKNK